MRHAVATAALLVAATAAPPARRAAATASTRVARSVVTVHATEFAFAAPATIGAGMTTLRLVNDGKALHQISLVQLMPGKTLAEYAAALKAHAPTPWAVGAGGPSAARPGQTVEATVTLDPGSYVLVCWAPAPGGQGPHMTALAVAAPDGRPAADGTGSISAPVPDMRLELSDYAFRFSKPLTAGTHIIQVVNTGTLEHEAVFVKLAPGKTVHDVAVWLEGGMRGLPPADVAPGMSGLGRGRAGTFPTDLAPGRYGLLCAISDEKDGRLHTAHGMMLGFTVAAR